MCLGGELRRTDVGHPDLDWAKSLGSQSSAVGADPSRYGRRLRLSGHGPYVTCNESGDNTETGQFDSRQQAKDLLQARSYGLLPHFSQCTMCSGGGRSAALKSVPTV